MIPCKHLSKRYLRIGLVASLLLAMGVANAEVLGPTYRIAEPDMLEEIERTLKAKERSGEMARLQKEAVERSKRSLEEPKAIAGLRKADRNRTLYFDPSFRVQNTIHDHEGRVVAQAGSVVNPLDYVSMPQHMLFFDGADPAQVRLADSLHQHYKGQIKLILTKGRPFQLAKERGVLIYFDQGGALVRKMGIEAVPSLVSQEAKRLRIDELRTE